MNPILVCPSKQEHDLDFKDHGIMIVGCGPYHIGEFKSFLPNHPLIFTSPTHHVLFSLVLMIN